MRWYILLCSLFLSFTVYAKPLPANNICHVMAKHPGWLKAVKVSEDKWDVPANIQLAIISHESQFDAKAKNHSSSAYGFAQVVNRTWHAYEKSVGNKSDRSDFEDAVDFIGWYVNRMHQQLGISTHNARKVYLAYHDGLGGYKYDLRHPHKQSSRLAKHVYRIAKRYQQQMRVCCDMPIEA